MRRLLLLAIVPVLIAGVGVVISRGDDRACPSGDDVPVPVLVARQWIPSGTSGSVIVRKRLYVSALIPCGDRKAGALADPSYLVGQVTVLDLFPGQQLTGADISSR